MTPALYACVHAEQFPAQALLRLRTDLATQPVVILDGRPPLQTVCSLNRPARMKGAAAGLTRLDAEAIPGLHLLARSPETEAAARAVLHECAAHFSPRLESVSEGLACACVLDITGTERLFGPPQTLAERLRDALASAGLRTSVSVSANFHTARLKAATTRGITVIPPGHQAASLSKLSMNVLRLPEDAAETFTIWGIRTLADLAALPEPDLIARLGRQALDWRNLARGELAHTFQSIEAEFTLQEFCAFETPVEQIDSLLFIGARMIDCLVTRAATRALSLASLTVKMQLDGGIAHQRTIRPALPTIDRKFLLKLLQLEVAAHPPQSAVLSLTLAAQAGQSSKVQLGLFAPQTPEPSRLDVTIARLKAIAGEDHVGSPVLEDTHRPDSFRMENFAVVQSLPINRSGLPKSSTLKSNPSKSAATKSSLVRLEEETITRPRMALRRIRPPAPVRVQLHDLRPAFVFDREQSFKVAAAYGPWRTSGCWWSTDPWNAEEWDVLAESSTGSSLACLLVHDRAQNQWQLEALYD
jgi:protein ImuB